MRHRNREALTSWEILALETLIYRELINEAGTINKPCIRTLYDKIVSAKDIGVIYRNHKEV